jgi:hypothetical protein
MSYGRSVSRGPLSLSAKNFSITTGKRIQQHNTPTSLPVFTLANEQRVLRDRLYAAAVADRLLEFLFDIDRYRGTGRLYLP